MWGRRRSSGLEAGLGLRAGGEGGHEQLHLVDEVAPLHPAPVHLLGRPPELAPLGVLDDVALRQLFDLAARELDQDLAAALRSVAH